MLEDRVAQLGEKRLVLTQQQQVGEISRFMLERERLRIPAIVPAIVRIAEK